MPTSLQSSSGTTLSSRRSWGASWGAWASWAAIPTIWGHKRPPKPRLQWPWRWGGGCSCYIPPPESIGSLIFLTGHFCVSASPQATVRLLTLTSVPQRRMLGYGAQYLHDYFSPWVNQNGGYVREDAPERPLTCFFTLFLKTLFSHRWRPSTVMMRRKWSNLKWGFPSCPNAGAPPISTNQQRDLEIKLKSSNSHFLPYVYRLVISTELSYLFTGTALLMFLCVLFLGFFLCKTNSWSHEQKKKKAVNAFLRNSLSNSPSSGMKINCGWMKL